MRTRLTVCVITNGRPGAVKGCLAMRRLATWCIGHRRYVIAIWLVALIGAGFGASKAGSDYSDNFNLPSSDSERALTLLQTKFPSQAGATATIAFGARNGTVDQPAVRKSLETAFAKIEKIPHVVGVVSPYAGDGAGQTSKDRTIAFATVQLDLEGSEIKAAQVEPIIDAAEAAGSDQVDVALGGIPIQVAQQAQDQGGTEMIGLSAAIIILLITFGSVVAMGLPLVTALFALGTGLSLVAISTHVFSVAEFAPQLAAMIGLGVGIDYALFIVTRYRSNLREGADVKSAIIHSVDTAGRAVLFAGVTVILALMGMLLLGVTFLYGVSVAAALAVLCTMIAALTLLPALLSLVGRRINRLKIPGLGKEKDTKDSRWYRWSRFIQRNPLKSALASGAVLLMLCVPALSLRLGSSDAGTDPANTNTRQSYDLLAKGFGPGFNGPFLIVSKLPSKDDLAPVKALALKISTEPGVAAVTPPTANPAGDTAVFQAYPATSPQSAATSTLLEVIRDGPIPKTEATTPGLSVYVGGPTAIYEDLGNVLTDKLPLFIGVVVLLSALLLMAVFRSILVPIKAVVMNLLSIGAAFGVVVAIFQWGWLGGLIGIQATGPIESFLPVMLFAIVFGLSMDYEVFLISRIHEEWTHNHNASDAVADGLASTGRVITAAAAIMVTVFASFVLGDDRVIKLFGVGLASAVFIDAVIIRTILVPSVMELMGRSAWWLPGWLDRILPNIAVEPISKDDREK